MSTNQEKAHIEDVPNEELLQIEKDASEILKQKIVALKKSAETAQTEEELDVLYKQIQESVRKYKNESRTTVGDKKVEEEVSGEGRDPVKFFNEFFEWLNKDRSRYLNSFSAWEWKISDNKRYVDMRFNIFSRHRLPREFIDEISDVPHIETGEIIDWGIESLLKMIGNKKIRTVLVSERLYLEIV